MSAPSPVEWNWSFRWGTVGSNQHLIQGMDALHARVCADQRDLFRLIAQGDRWEVWRDSGARDMAHWLWMRYGISSWKAHRWLAAAHALEDLPQIARAFASGELGIDKVVELTRFATPETETDLIPWAMRVSTGRVRRKADLAVRRSARDAQDAERDRRLSWWYSDDGRRFGLEAELPAADGAVVAKALERVAESIPVMPGEDETGDAEARRADALVALASARIAVDPDPDRSTVVLHASAEALVSEDQAQEIEGGGIVDSMTARRLLCNSRLHVVIEDAKGDPVRVGRVTREPPAWMLRQLRYRDRECMFPGCGARQFLQAHHIVWWERGGRTILANLILVCFFHHKLVHEYGWRISRGHDGIVRWFRPDGVRYRAGPAPPPIQEREPAMSAPDRRRG